MPFPTPLNPAAVALSLIRSVCLAVPPSSRVRHFVCAFLVLGASASGAHAQIPETFENLELLDPKIERGELVSIMRDWAGGLGVRCTYCHVGPDNLVGMDFATDEKETKQAARKMLEMSRQLNREGLAGLPTLNDGARHQVVSCYSCHRGQAKPPQNIRVLLGGIVASAGLEAAIEKYRELREEHYGFGRYDFSQRSLSGMGQQLLEMGRPADAASFYRMGLEYYPESPDLYAGLAMALFQGEDEAGGEEALARAFELDPNNRTAQFVKQQRESLK